MKAKERVGQKFGIIIICKIAEQQDGKGTLVECICECGTIKNIRLKSLVSGDTRSCGCLGKETMSKNGKNWILKNRTRPVYSPEYANSLDCYRKYMARHKGNLTIEQFLVLTKQNCFYCNKPPSQIYRLSFNKRATSAPFVYNGLDRIDNTVGYDYENVLPCCKTCNFMRHSLTQQELFVQIIAIILHDKSRINKFGYDLINHQNKYSVK